MSDGGRRGRRGCRCGFMLLRFLVVHFDLQMMVAWLFALRTFAFPSLALVEASALISFRLSMNKT